MKESDPIPLNCPRCGKPMTMLRIGSNGGRSTYRCLCHGRFWIDDNGRLREQRRSRSVRRE
jgi:hypothetical protein